MKELGKDKAATKSEPATENGVELPKEVICAFGEVPYEVFRERYADVYKQIHDMDHLLFGRITYTGKLGPKEFQMRTLKQQERALIASVIPAQNTDTFTRDMMLYEVYKVVLSLKAFGEVKLSPTAISLEEPLSVWVEKNKATIDTVMDFDETLTRHLSNIYEDISQAKQYAFMEILPNP